MKSSIQEILFEHQDVLNKRKQLDQLFNMIASCHVSIGGSYALKFWCSAFSEREVSDYDFIVRGSKDELEKIDKFVTLQNTITRWFKLPEKYQYMDRKSFYMGELRGKKINVILEPTEDIVVIWDIEFLEDIIDVKRQWCKEYISKGQRPRYKDVHDIALYEEWKSKNAADPDLPF